MEQVAGLLANYWSDDHEVAIVTDTPAGNDTSQYPYKVFRSLPKLKLLKLLKDSNIIVVHGLSLKYVPYIWLVRHKVFIVHHTYYQRNLHGKQNQLDKLKLFILRFFHNISVSHALANRLTVSSKVIHNPYNDDIFFRDETPKSKDVIFAGRLVSDKGCITLLQALFHLKKKAIPLLCTIVGDGKENHILKEYVLKNEFTDRIVFKGALNQIQLAEELRKHKIMVVPSIWEEPFGLVVLEGLACGCRMIVSDKGGLPEALDGFGNLFQAGNDIQLADILEKELKKKPEPNADPLRKYLKTHSASQVAETYIRYFESSL